MINNLDTLNLESHNDHVLIISLNRPHAANAINLRMMEELTHIFINFPNEHSEIRCVVLTGAGERVFSAGADLKERNNISVEEWQRQHEKLERAVLAVAGTTIPIIAAVNGAAYGGGCELALLADFIYSAHSARFALPEVTLGFIPGAGGTQNLQLVSGIARAKEIIFTGESFGSEEAFRWGIVNRICEDKNLMKEVLKTADKIAINAPIALEQAKMAMNAAFGNNFPLTYKTEIRSYNNTIRTKDREEGIRAFNDKRVARFNGH